VNVEKVFFDENTLSVQCKMKKMYAVCTVKFSINPNNVVRNLVNMFVNMFYLSDESNHLVPPVKNMLHELADLGLDSMNEKNPNRKFKFSKNTLKLEEVKQSNPEFEFYFDFKKYINQN
jgi:hypothetical protein